MCGRARRLRQLGGSLCPAISRKRAALSLSPAAGAPIASAMADISPRTGLAGRLRTLFGRAAPALPADVPATAAALPESGGWQAFRLVAAGGGWVQLPPGADVMALGPAAEAALVIVPDYASRVCFLVAPDGREMGVVADPMRARAISLRLSPTDVPGAIRLLYPIGRRRFLTADAAGGLRMDGGGHVLEAVFALAAVDGASVPAVVQVVADAVAAACRRGLRAPVLLAWLQEGGPLVDLAPTLLRLLPEEELEELARILLGQPAELALLASAMPGERWVTQLLPALAVWQPERPEVEGHVTTCPASDEPALVPASGEGVVPAGLALHALARRQILPRRLACIVAAARNEGPYLLDWLSYHLSVGFEHVFLYTNENTDGSDELLGLLARHGVITLVQNARAALMGPQLKGYTHALTMLPQVLDYRWAALLDIDEYFAFEPGVFTGVADFLAVQETQRVDAIALCWAVFAALPEDRWSDEATWQRFTRRQRQVSPLVKSLIRPRKFWYSQPHFPTAVLEAPYEFRAADGRVHHHAHVEGRIAAESGAPAAEQAWVNHYMLRSGEEALWKWSRGRGDLPTGHAGQMRLLDDVAAGFLNLSRPEHLVQDTRIAACARGQAAVLARLLALPGVAACEAEIKARFGREIRENARAFAAEEGGSASVRYFREMLVG